MEIKVLRKSLLAIVVSSSLLASSFAQASEPTVTFYDIAGSSANALRKQIDAMRPQDSSGERFDAVTKSSVSYTYRYAPTPNGCKFTEFSPTLKTSITMPRWVDIDQTSELGKKWQSYYEALYSHELGHHNVAMASFKELEEVGRTFETSKKCDSIGDEFKLVQAEIMQKGKLENLKYDLETDHGKKRGATFP